MSYDVPYSLIVLLERWETIVPTKPVVGVLKLLKVKIMRCFEKTCELAIARFLLIDGFPILLFFRGRKRLQKCTNPL